MSWSNDIIEILKKIRINSYLLSVKHRQRYNEFKDCSKYFDLPTIILSIFSSTFISFEGISVYKKVVVNTSISMFIAILTSIKLYLNLDSSINQSEQLSHDFYLLSINIFKMLELDETNRKVDGSIFLNEIYSEYIKLLDSSNIFKKEIKGDALIEDIKLSIKTGSTLLSKSSNSSNSSSENPFADQL